MLPPVTVELHATTYLASGKTAYRLAVVFSTATVMSARGAHLGFAENTQPMPSEDVWFYGGRWAILPPYNDWEVIICSFYPFPLSVYVRRLLGVVVEVGLCTGLFFLMCVIVAVYFIFKPPARLFKTFGFLRAFVGTFSLSDCCELLRRRM